MADTGITPESLKTRLANVQNAINGILKAGQSYSRSGVSISKVPLADLRKEEQYLVRQISRSDSGAVSASQVGPNNQQSVDNDYTWSHA